MVRVTENVYRKISYRKNTEGIVALVKKKKMDIDSIAFKNKKPLVLVAENIEKPGNIGAMLRTADASKIDCLLIAEPQTDVYNPNVIRSSVGGFFSVPIGVGTNEEVHRFLNQHHITPHAAGLEASVSYETIDFTKASAVVVGAESTGLSKFWLKASKSNIKIPMLGTLDSMNVSVAAGITIEKIKNLQKIAKNRLRGAFGTRFGLRCDLLAILKRFFINFSSPPRRNLIRNSFSLAPFFSSPGLMAETLILTPLQTEGPFYPDIMPLDTDNDLIVINDSLTPGVGKIAYLRGKVTDIKGNPQRNALIEIWQVDNHGVYLHTRGGSREKLDRNFQGYGRFLTDSKGNYFFRTLKPSPYSGRTPHIHISVSAQGKQKFTTQCYIKGEPRNQKDFILRRVKDAKARNSLIVPFNPVKGSKLQEVSAKFDIVLGWTPEG